MKINFTKLTLLTLTLSGAMSVLAGTKTPKREFRSTWFTTHVNIDWPQSNTRGTSASAVAKQKADMITYIEGFERMNLNGACFQVRAQCDALYKSSYEPWSAVVSGTRGTDPGWDPLQFCIDECHKRGLECYAWINPFRWSTGTDYNTAADKDFKAKGWILSYGGYYVLNPAIPEAREHILKVCKEIVDNYEIDGVLFDDYFYPNNIPENESAGDWAQYKASGSKLGIGDWRRENINEFVRQFKVMIEESHPDMRFGISPAGVAGASAGKYGLSKPNITSSDWQYNTIYSDPLAWLSEGSIDFISPQIYWETYHSTAPYEPLCDWWTMVAEKFGRHFYSSQSVYFFTGAGQNTTTAWSEVVKQVSLNRKYAEPTALNAPGTIYYSSKYFYGPALSGLGDYLLENSNQTKALVPVVSWKKVPSFGAPQNLKLSGNTLTWTPLNAPKSIMRYTVYAVPKNLSVDEAADEYGDGISNDYLLKVSYDAKFELPSTAQGDYWYAVCAYDGAGNEFEPAIVNYPQGASAKVSLTSPANNATIDWHQTFSWTAVTNAQYILKIANDENLSDIVYLSDNLSSNSVQPDLSMLNPQTRYYWNVTCTEPGKLASASETRSFMTGKFADAPVVSLVAPEDGAECDNNIKFRWNTNSALNLYTLEVSRTSSFQSLVYSTSVTEGEVTVNPSLIGKGDFFWRVTGSGDFLNPTSSQSRRITINALPVGEYEPGYVIKQDPANYPTVDNVEIENLWVRSSKDGYKNISFESDGMMERGMVAVDDYVYLTRRSENGQSAMIYLEKYDGETGEHIATIELDDSGRIPFYPLNTVVKDEADNVIIANLSLDATTTPVVLHKVNLHTGELTEVANIRLSNLDKSRTDHINVLGDVSKGNFTVYLPLASTTKIARVDYTDGKQSNLKVVTLSQFYPSTVAHIGIAAFVTPLTYDYVLANGGGTGLALYDLATGKLVDNIASCSEVKGGATNANGSAQVQIGKNFYTIYPATDEFASNGFTFNIVKGSARTFADCKLIATVPQQGLGKIASSTASTPVSVVTKGDGSANVYVYAVGNGLAAYRLSDLSTSVSAIDASDLSVTVMDNRIVFSRNVESVHVFTLSGMQISAASHTDFITVPCAGHYIVVADGRTWKLMVE